MPMLFHKTQKSLARIAKQVGLNVGAREDEQERRIIVIPPQIELKKGGVDHRAALEVINTADAVPEGRYVPFDEIKIPMTDMESFSVLRRSATSAVLLVAQEDHQSHAYYSVLSRLKSAGFVDGIEVTVVSREIIKLQHSKNRSVERQESTDLEKLGEAMIDDAVYKEASDIHFEVEAGHASVIFRIHGVRIKQSSMSSETAMALASVLYGVHGQADSKEDWNPGKVLDTTIARNVPNGPAVQLRWNSVPRFPVGLSAVMRITRLDMESFRALKDVGYTTGMLAVVAQMLRGGSGLVILVGPTNSGKSSAMQALVAELYAMRGPMIKVQTAEDPVEYIIPSAIQTSAQGNLKYSDAVKSMLRQDPDIVMVGEVRDADSAENVTTLALTGRKVLTTLHVSEASASFARLRELGVPDSVLYMKGFISGIICQRLVPVLCPHCSLPIADAVQEGIVDIELQERLARVVNFKRDNVRFRRIGGCEKCKHVGIIGRTPIAEMLVPDQKYMSFIKAGDFEGADAYWAGIASRLDVDGNGVNMLAHAIQKIREGVVCPKDIENVISEIALDHSVDAVPRSVPLPAQDFLSAPMLAHRTTIEDGRSQGMLGHPELEHGGGTWN